MYNFTSDMNFHFDKKMHNSRKKNCNNMMVGLLEKFNLDLDIQREMRNKLDISDLY